MTTTPARDALLSILRSERSGSPVDGSATMLDDAAAERLVDAAQAHRVGSLLHDRMTASGALPDAALQRLAGLRRLARARNLRVGSTALEVSSVLDRATDGRWAVVKGPALAWWYGSALRTYADLDVLVERDHFASVLAALEAAGHPPLTANWEGFLEHGVAEVPLGDYHMTIDLHWDLVAMRQVRRGIRLPVSDLLDRRVMVDVAGGQLPTLDPADTLTHLCVHTGLGGARRLIWLSDVDVVARSGSVDWPAFASRARSAGAAAVCAIVLDRARELLDTPVPEGFVEELAPFGWLAVDRATRRRRSDEDTIDRGWSTGIVGQMARDRPGAALSATLRTGYEEVRVRLGGTAMTSEGGDIDWHAVDHDTDVTAERQAYLAYVGSDAP